MEQQEEQKQKISIIKRALLVEDYVPCQKIMTHYLNKLGYQVDLAVDGTTAIQNIHIKVYDLIIEDINLHGGISGKEVIQEIRNSKLNVGTPLLIWSAYVNKNGEEKYLVWGADGVLIKVCQIKELKRAIEKCFLITRYYRKFYYQLWNFKIKWERFIIEPKKLKDREYIKQFKFSLNEALLTIEEYHQWLNLHGREAETQIIK